jgi:hypothetical protein
VPKGLPVIGIFAPQLREVKAAFNMDLDGLHVEGER